jgi:hypothetical protein
VIRLGVDQRVPAAGQVQRQQPVLFGRAEPEGLSVELLRRLKVIDGEPAERLGVREHAMLLFMMFISPVQGIDVPVTANPSAPAGTW